MARLIVDFDSDKATIAKKKPIPIALICACGLFAAFFLPWLQSEDFRTVNANEFIVYSGLSVLWIVPILAVIAIIAQVFRFYPNAIALIAGVASSAVLVFATRNIVLNHDMHFSFGLHIAIVSLIGLVVAPLVSKLNRRQSRV